MQGWSEREMATAVENIYDTTLSIFNEAKAKNILPSMAADQWPSAGLPKKVAQAFSLCAFIMCTIKLNEQAIQRAQAKCLCTSEICLTSQCYQSR